MNVSITKVGTKNSIIPSSAYLKGTIRTIKASCADQIS